MVLICHGDLVSFVPLSLDAQARLVYLCFVI